MNCEFIKLNNGSKIPALGLGTFRSQGESLTVAIRAAINCGYRHFDTAQVYQNEDILGDELRECINESNGKLKREDFYLVSKIWCTNHSRNRVKESFAETLKKLRVDYLDLLLIHWPMGFKVNRARLASNSTLFNLLLILAQFDKETGGGLFPTDAEGTLLASDISFCETYKAMEELVKEGKVKSIGVSNFNMKQLEEILKMCEIRPAVNQIEIHPYHQNRRLVEFCCENEIAVEAYAPIGAGRVQDIWTKSCGVLDDPVLTQIAKKYKKTVAQVCLRWGLQRGFVVIPKSVTPSRILENSLIFDFELSKADMTAIQGIDQERRVYQVGLFKSHKLYPYEEKKEEEE